MRSISVSSMDRNLPKKHGLEVPNDLSPAYFEALSKLPSLVAQAAAREWDADFLQCALAAISVTKGQTSIAEAALELTPEIAEEFMEWFYDR